MRRYVIIGSGVAGIAALEAIRAQDWQGEILLIGDEVAGFYSRPGLAYLLTGEVTEQQLLLYKEQDYRERKIKCLRARVTHIFPERHEIRLSNGKVISFDRLLIATGASALMLTVQGNSLEGVVKLDCLEDARHIIRLSRRARTAVVVGGGITALEIVEGLAERGVKIEYFLRGDRYWANVLDQTESRIIEHRLRQEGVNIHFHTELEEIIGENGRVSAVRCKDGQLVECDIVAAAIGIQPRVQLAKIANLDVERGIRVSEFMQTSSCDVFAAGDIAQVYDPFTGETVLDSLWGPAREQGFTAGLNMAGVTTPYSKKIAFNITRLANLTATIIGAVGNGKDEDLFGIARGDSEVWRHLPDAIAAQSHFEVNRLRILLGSQSLIGAVLIGDQTLSRALQDLVNQKVDISRIRDQLLQPAAPIADILAHFWASQVESLASAT